MSLEVLSTDNKSSESWSCCNIYLSQVSRQRKKASAGEHIAKELRMMGHTEGRKDIGIKSK
jgi:hypothetical protein